MKQNETMEVVAEGIMTEQEFEERKGYVTLMRNFQNMSLEVMKAIEHIKEKKLYRPYRTLEEFCIAECGWTKRRYYQIKKFSEVKKALPPKSEPVLQTERQARELAKYPEEQRAEILEEAAKFHAKDGEITPKSIERAATMIEPVDQTNFPIPSGDASYYWSLSPQGKELAADIHAIGMRVKALDPDDTFWRLCDLPTVLNDLRSAWKRLKGGLPAYVCTKCGGVKPKGCDFCKGRGTVGTWAWRNCGDDKHAIERAVREARKKNAHA